MVTLQSSKALNSNSTVLTWHEDIYIFWHRQRRATSINHQSTKLFSAPLPPPSGCQSLLLHLDSSNHQGPPMPPSACISISKSASIEKFGERFVVRLRMQECFANSLPMMSFSLQASGAASSCGTIETSTVHGIIGNHDVHRRIKQI